MSLSVTPFLMFTGQAEAAMTAYVALFPEAAITALQRKPDGKVQQAFFTLAGQTVRCFDSDPIHAFGFTPSFSFFVECEDEAQQARLYEALLEGGQALMPLSDYGFSRRFGWLNDRFGVSWQLNLA